MHQAPTKCTRTSVLEKVALKRWAKLMGLNDFGDFAEFRGFVEFKFFVEDAVSDQWLLKPIKKLVNFFKTLASVLAFHYRKIGPIRHLSDLHTIHIH
jgi:hypothetical protein